MDILQPVIQVSLDATTIELCPELRDDLGDKIGLNVSVGIWRDIVGISLAERYPGSYRPVTLLGKRAAAKQADNDREDNNGAGMQTYDSCPAGA
jgi:hypothetical protein